MTSTRSHTFIVLLFVFFNYFNPVSVYITLLFNVALAVYLVSIKKEYRVKFDSYVIFITMLILIWSIIIMLSRADVDIYILGKYSRVLISTLLIVFICSGWSISVKQLVTVLGVVFFSHILAIVAQTVNPDLSAHMAGVFGMAEAADFFIEYNDRKMGLSGSFDTASLVSILSMIFFFLQYQVKHKNVYLILALLSFGACAMSSRMGMVIGFFIFLMFIINLFSRAKGRDALLILLIMVAGSALVFYFILPVILHSFQWIIIEFEPQIGDISTAGYGTTGTVDALFGSHLEPLKVPLMDLFFGFGYDPDGTDIGYVKLIYHIGIIGSFLIFILYLYMYFIKNLK